jgi:CheY-like chemotaxis protein/glycine cleavage system H lipoate-binding protein
VSSCFDLLLVEDDRVVREAAARILHEEGLTIDRADDVSQAVARLRNDRHRVVLTDLMLPGFSGFDLLDRVASDRPQLPVVMITGYATIENALQAFRRGAFDFLPKPFDVAELLGVVRRALRAADDDGWNALSPPPVEPIGETPDGEPAVLHFLGQHAWAAVENGLATFGVAESFVDRMGEVDELRLPDAGVRLTQGLAFAEISTVNQSIHRVWSPLSGTVIENNPAVESDPGLLHRAPFSSGWLTRIEVAATEEQWNALTLRAGTPARPARATGGKEKRWSF